MTVLLYFLNTACAAGQSALGKKYAHSGGQAWNFNLNKAIAGLVFFALWGAIQGSTFHLPTLALSAGYGAALCISMHAGFKALHLGPMALTSSLVSFSLLIPFFFGICFWGEAITLWSGLGIALLLTAILLISGKLQGGVSGKWFLYTLITLVANGAASVIQKYHQLHFPGLYRTEFMVFALAAVLIVLSLSRIGKQPVKKFRFSGLGAVSGILNCAANYTILLLSATENASVLFPVVSVATIVSVWLVGLVFFKEKLTVRQTLGVLIGTLSVVLLKL